MEKNTYIIHTQVLERYGDEYEDYKFKFGQTLVAQDATKESAIVLATEMMHNSNNKEIIEYPISVLPINEWYENLISQPRYKDLLIGMENQVKWNEDESDIFYDDMEDSFLWELKFSAFCTPRKNWLFIKGRHDFFHLNNISNKVLELYLGIDKRIFNLLYRRSISKWAQMYDKEKGA